MHLPTPLHPRKTNNIATIAFLLNPVRNLIRTFASQAPNPAAMSAAKVKAQGIIDENPVVVFSKSYCPYCKATKALLSEKGAKFYALELDQIGQYYHYSGLSDA